MISFLARKFHSIVNRISNIRNLHIIRRYNSIIGSGCWFIGNIHYDIHPTAKIAIGNRVVFTSGSNYNTLCSNTKGSIKLSDNAILTIGNDCGLSSPHIWGKECIQIGHNVNIGADCIILDNDCHSLDWKIRSDKQIDSQGECLDYQNAASAPVCIGDHVWIGARTIILKGVTIGARTIIGAGSVVTKSIPSDSIAAGNPCRVIKQTDYATKGT